MGESSEHGDTEILATKRNLSRRHIRFPYRVSHIALAVIVAELIILAQTYRPEWFVNTDNEQTVNPGIRYSGESYVDPSLGDSATTPISEFMEDIPGIVIGADGSITFPEIPPGSVQLFTDEGVPEQWQWQYDSSPWMYQPMPGQGFQWYHAPLKQYSRHWADPAEDQLTTSLSDDFIEQWLDANGQFDEDGFRSFIQDNGSQTKAPVQERSMPHMYMFEDERGTRHKEVRQRMLDILRESGIRIEQQTNTEIRGA